MGQEDSHEQAGGLREVGGQMGHLPALGAALHSQAESDLRQSVAKSNRYVAERRKQRSRGGTRVRGLDELYRWAGVAPEHRVRALPNRPTAAPAVC